MPGTTTWLDATLPVLSSGVWWWLLLDIRCLWRHKMTSYSRLQTNVLAIFCWHNTHIQGCRSSGKPGGAVKQLRAMETCQKQKIATKYVCFCSSTMPTSKTITKLLENHFEFSGCRKSCNKFVSSQSWFAMKLPMRLLCKAVVLEVGFEVVQAHLQKFWIFWKSEKNPWKSGYKWRPALFDFKKWYPRFAEKHMKTTFWGHTKQGLCDLC